MAEEKFSISEVRSKMNVIEGYFREFSSTLAEINAFVETNVNASLASSAYGDLGGKLLSVWNHNSATFQDFHENFDQWAKVVAIISANNNEFAVNAQATYRDNAGTLDGIKEAREFVSKNNGIKDLSAGEGFSSLSNDGRKVLDDLTRGLTKKVKDNNTYGGRTVSYTDAAGNKIEIHYDEEGRLVGKKVTDTNGKTTYYDENGEKVDKLPTKEEWEEKHSDKLADSHYLNHLDDLKYGSFTREIIEVDGEKIPCYIYKPDYGTEVTDLPVMMYMTGQSKTGTGEGIITYGGLGEALKNKTVTPSGLVVIPYVPNGDYYESASYRNKLNKIPSIVAEKYNGDKNRMSVGGCSYGGLTAYKLVTEHPGTYAAVVTAAGANDVDSSFKGVSVVNFLPDGKSGSSHTNSGYIIQQSNAVNKVGGKSQTIKIDGQYGHTNVATYGFQKKYDFDGDGKTEYAFEWAFNHTLNDTSKG